MFMDQTNTSSIVRLDGEDHQKPDSPSCVQPDRRIALDHIREGSPFFDAMASVPPEDWWRPVPMAVLSPRLNTTDRRFLMSVVEVWCASEYDRVRSGLYLSPDRAAAMTAIDRRVMLRRAKHIEAADIGVSFELMPSREGRPWNVVRFDERFRSAIGSDRDFVKMPRAVMFDGWLSSKEVETYLAVRAHHFRYRGGVGSLFSMSVKQLAGWLDLGERAATTRRDALLDEGLLINRGRRHGHEANTYRLSPLTSLYTYVADLERDEGLYVRPAKWFGQNPAPLG